MAYDDFKDQETARKWDADTLSYNPGRTEQLDMLVTLLEAEYQPGKAILDLGIGSGRVEELIFQRIPGAQVVGVDASQAMMAMAHERLQPYASQYVALEHDLAQIQTLQLPLRAYQFVISIQTLHHLTEPQMQTAYQAIYDVLEPNGLFVLMDRIAVDKPGLFACYQHLWRRQARLQGSPDRAVEGETFESPQQIVRERGDLPQGLEWHLQHLNTTGFEAACLHLHANRALIAARKS